MWVHRLFAVVAALVLITSIVMAVSNRKFAGDYRRFPELFAPSPADDQAESGESTAVTPAQGAPVTQEDLQMSVETTADLPQLAGIPWDLPELEAAFKASASAAHLLAAGESVIDTTMPFKSADRLSRRVPAFAIGLAVDRNAEADLPSLTRSAIKSYLNDHLLSIQPMLTEQTAHPTRVVAPLTAAFYNRKKAAQTIAAESMIVQALQELRVLGEVTPPADGSATGIPVLVIGFAFTRDETTEGIARAVRDYELLLVRNLGTGIAKPDLRCYSTSESRSKLHRLILDDSAAGAEPSVTATIRFDDFTFAGLYPASPVVTGVRLRSAATTEVSRVRQQLTAGTASLAAILDQLDKE